VKRNNPSCKPVTINPMASIWAASKMLGRGSGPVPRFKACKLPKGLSLISSTNGCHAFLITSLAGVSYPDNPGNEISFLSVSLSSVISLP
jgi:hypothetical protein